MLAMFFKYLVSSLCPYGLINKRTDFNILNGLDFKFKWFYFFSERIRSKFLW